MVTSATEGRPLALAPLPPPASPVLYTGATAGAPVPSRPVAVHTIARPWDRVWGGMGGRVWWHGIACRMGGLRLVEGEPARARLCTRRTRASLSARRRGAWFVVGPAYLQSGRWRGTCAHTCRLLLAGLQSCVCLGATCLWSPAARPCGGLVAMPIGWRVYSCSALCGVQTTVPYHGWGVRVVPFLGVVRLRLFTFCILNVLDNVSSVSLLKLDGPTALSVKATSPYNTHSQHRCPGAQQASPL